MKEVAELSYLAWWHGGIVVACMRLSRSCAVSAKTNYNQFSKTSHFLDQKVSNM